MRVLTKFIKVNLSTNLSLDTATVQTIIPYMLPKENRAGSLTKLLTTDSLLTMRMTVRLPVIAKAERLRRM